MKNMLIYNVSQFRLTSSFTGGHVKKLGIFLASLLIGSLSASYMEDLFVNNLPKFASMVAALSLGLLAIIAWLLYEIWGALLQHKKRESAAEISNEQVPSS